MSELYVFLTKDDDSRIILQYCYSPKTSDEIMSYVLSYKRTMYPASYRTLTDVQSLVGVRLANLELQKALVYENEQWKTTDTAKAILKKYFGIKS